MTVASDGGITSSDEMSNVVLNHPELVAEIEEEANAAEKLEGIVDGSKPNKPESSKGKLIVEEERAIGRVSLRSCELFLVCAPSIQSDFSTKVSLYFGNMGGLLYWVGFWLMTIGVEVITV